MVPCFQRTSENKTLKRLLLMCTLCRVFFFLNIESSGSIWEDWRSWAGFESVLFKLHRLSYKRAEAVMVTV